VRIGSRTWPHECQTSGLLEVGGPRPLILLEFRAAAVLTLAVGVHEEDVAGKQEGAVCNRD